MTRHECHCGKSFIRKEHLRRHQASHDERSFVCPICQRAFTRNDLLRRHINTHPAQATKPARTRACDACHANKTKCDGGPQCSLCKRRGIDCVYSSRSDAESTATAGKNMNMNLDMDMNHTKAPSPAYMLKARIVPVDSLYPYAEILPGARDSSLDLDRDDADLVQSAGSHHEDVDMDEALPDPELQPPHHFWLREILEDTSRSASNQSPLEGAEAPDDFKKWLAFCFRSYIQNFHHYWQIIHAPVYDFRERSHDNAVAVVIIGTWFQGCQASKNLAKAINSKLIDKYTSILVSCLLFPSSPWRCLSAYLRPSSPVGRRKGAPTLSGPLKSIRQSSWSKLSPSTME